MVAKRLPPDVNRILLVKNLPFNITADEIYDLFGKYGAIRQVRMSDSNDTKGRPHPQRASATSPDRVFVSFVASSAVGWPSATTSF